jgi:hypothetical protein
VVTSVAGLEIAGGRQPPRAYRHAGRAKVRRSIFPPDSGLFLNAVQPQPSWSSAITYFCSSSLTTLLRLTEVTPSKPMS